MSGSASFKPVETFTEESTAGETLDKLTEKNPNESIIWHKTWWGLKRKKASRLGCVDKVIERHNTMIAIHEKEIENLAKRQDQTIDGLEHEIREKDKVIEGLRLEIEITEESYEMLKQEVQAADETIKTLRQATKQEQEKAREQIWKLELQLSDMKLQANEVKLQAIKMKQQREQIDSLAHTMFISKSPT
ncbi:MAG: hypothetical protein LQ342_006962 [Letrouitia transgressa]|nr:MAG: hypothetical protein LQ342_006962 [Letrouitia transgressa]